jgi:hypothetical protein
LGAGVGLEDSALGLLELAAGDPGMGSIPGGISLDPSGRSIASCMSAYIPKSAIELTISIPIMTPRTVNILGSPIISCNP